MSELDLTCVDQIVQRLGGRADSLIPILRAIQGHYRYLPPEALKRVAELTEIAAATIAGVSTFYGQFHSDRRPPRRPRLSRHSLSRQRRPTVQESLKRRLKIAPGRDTDADGQFTIEKVACLSCCTLRTVVQIDGVTYGNLSPLQVNEAMDIFSLGPTPAPRRLDRRRPWFCKSRWAKSAVGLGSCCVAQGSGGVMRPFARRSPPAAPGGGRAGGSVGMCHQTPLLELAPAGGGPGKLFAKALPDNAADIVLSQFRPRGVVRRIGYAVSGWLDRLHSDKRGDPALRHAMNVHDEQVSRSLGRQPRVATEHCGQLTGRRSLDEYIRCQGFEACEILERLSPEGDH